MKFSRSKLSILILAFSTSAVLFGSCKAKKIAAIPPAVQVTEEVKPAPTPAPVEREVETAPAPAPEKMPDFNYSNIQFEFNSAVLKTSSYSVLDQIAAEMKKYPAVKFNIKGHSSLEGTEQRNMTLSIDRANAVKAFIVNVGVEGSNLTSIGLGESKPIASNDTEQGRVLNRRVEIEKIN
ncbi:OmpA family protein [Daejeonella oryzae]|uniref:OmpA family protein n=1 Tax=Daejeonella oryzae TaxID=1122943 RepID=UPI000426448A|nr:OmpA family protein [Daejeonella oryzae]